MKTIQRFALTLALALAVLFAAPKPAAAQQEDAGYIMTQLAQTTGCSPCYQSCVMTGLVIQFDYNMPALMGWLSAVASAYQNITYEIMENDGWFIADWPFISNQKPAVMRPVEPGEIPSPKEYLRRWKEQHKNGPPTVPYYLQPAPATL